jgi:uncharacterized protein YegP (UPF0339 family)
MTDAPGHFRLKTVTDGSGGSLIMWTLTTDMGQTVATSERFPDRAAAEKTIQWLKDNVAICDTLDPPHTGPNIA